VAESGNLPSDVLDLLLVQALRSFKSDDQETFRRLLNTRNSLRVLTGISFLLYSPSEGRQDNSYRPKRPHGVYSFLFDTVPVLLPQLSRVTEPQRVALQDQVRGRVDWSGTYKARYRADGSPSVFVCLQNLRRFDRPENQLFKYLLHKIQMILDQMPPELRVWRAWGKAVNSAQGKPLHLDTYFAILAHRVRAFNAHVHLQEIQTPIAIDRRHLLAARTSKNPLYVEVADLYDLYETLVDKPVWDHSADVLGQILPLPPTADEVAQLLTI
jgi:hypothetical protein